MNAREWLSIWKVKIVAILRRKKDEIYSGMQHMKVFMGEVVIVLFLEPDGGYTPVTLTIIHYTIYLFYVVFLFFILWSKHEIFNWERFSLLLEGHLSSWNTEQYSHRILELKRTEVIDLSNLFISQMGTQRAWEGSFPEVTQWVSPSPGSKFTMYTTLFS